MYTYKCYYHPKETSVQPCKGCKLPLCVGCAEVEGFCSVCNEKRAAVKQLRQLRTAIAANSHIATTTGRLRAARRHMMENKGTGSKRRLTPSSSLVRPEAQGTGARIVKPVPAQDRLQTRPLDSSVLAPSTPLVAPTSVSQQLPPAPRPVARPARREPEPQPRRYNPEGVAYRSANAKNAQPAAPARKKRVVAAPAAAPKRDTAVAWFWPFLIGIGVGVVLMVGMVLAQPFLKTSPTLKYRPKFSSLSQSDKAAIDRVLKTQVVDTLAQVKDPEPVAMAPVTMAASAPRPAYIRVSQPRAHRTYRAASAPVRRTPRQPTLAEAIKFTTVPVASAD